MKRQTLYLIVACLTLAAGLALTSNQFSTSSAVPALKLVSEDGVGSGTMKTWESPDGLKVYESVAHYASVENARKDFAAELKSAEAIIERRTGLAGLSEVDESAIAIFVHPESKEKTFRVIRINNQEIHSAEGPTLESVQAFK